MPRIVEVFGDYIRVEEVESGSSINDYMLAKYPDLQNFPVPVVAGYVKEDSTPQDSPEKAVEVVLRADWGKTIPDNRTIVLMGILRPLGGGGGGGKGGGIMQAVLGAVMVVAAAVMWWNPMGWAAFAGLSASFLGGLAITGGVLLLGGLMGQTGVQPKGISASMGNADSSPTYSINATTNQARLLQPVPEGFGKIQIVPDIVANAYTAYEGNDQYMYAVYGIGRGLYTIHELKFGDEAFWRDGEVVYESSLVSDVGDIEVEIVQPGNAVTLFPDNVESNGNVSQIQLFSENNPEYKGWMGPYTCPPAGTTASKFQFDFQFPRGVGWWDMQGNLGRWSIAVGIQYQSIDDYDEPIGSWKDLPDFDTGSLATLTAQRMSQFVELPEGRYQFRFKNLNTTGSDGASSRPVDDCYLDGLRAYLAGTLKYNQTVVAIKIKATNNLSNSASQELKCLYTRKLPIWNQTTRTWSGAQETRRFDAAIAWMCKCSWGGRLPDSRIDLDSLAYCQKKCDEYGWNFDAYIDEAYSVMELICQACKPYRVFPRLIGDKITFIFDEANRPVKHVFTPRDITRGSLSPSWAIHTELTPDDIIVSYLDEDVNYARREVECKLPDSESLQQKYLQYPIGICNRKLAHDYGIYVAACNRYRRISVEFSTEGMSRLLYAGDVISVQHPRLRTIGTGKVVDWNAQKLRIYIDTADCDFDPTTKQALWAVFNKPDGSIWGPVRLRKYFNGYMQLNQSDYETVKSQQGDCFPWLDAGYASQPTTFALQTGGNIDRRFIIQNVKYSDLNHGTLTAMNDDQRVYAMNVPVPPWNYRNNNSVSSRLETPIGFHYTNNEVFRSLRLAWSRVPGAESYTLSYHDAKLNDDGSIKYSGVLNRIPYITNTYIEMSHDNFFLNTIYLFRVQAVNSKSTSLWSSYLTITPRPVTVDPDED